MSDDEPNLRETLWPWQRVAVFFEHLIYLNERPGYHM